MNILDMDATRLSEELVGGSITSVQATEAYIEHLHRMNPILNCLTQERFEEARQEAAASDARRRNGEAVGRLDGVPVSIKDCFHVEGMRTTGGLIERKDLIEQKDAEVVAKLRREGAIVLGKTNTPTLCFCQETDNKLHGRTNNPWDPDRTAGGSSGGEGALIAAGGAAVGLGADIGGSIRFPSHFNGIVGFKSGNQQVDPEGNFPIVVLEEQDRMLGIGAMAKSVRDARLINDIIARTLAPVRELEGFRIEVPGRQTGLPLGDETDRILERIREALRGKFELGHDQLPHWDGASKIWQEAMSIDGGQGLIALLSGSKPMSPLKEYLKETLWHRSNYHSYLTWALIGARLFQPSAARVREIRSELERGDRELAEYFEHRIAILPIYHRGAQLHGKVYKELFSVRKTYMKFIPYVAYANTWGLPVLIVPVGEDQDGMPVAVQLVSKVGNEDALFRLGEFLEAGFRGYKRCEDYDG